MKALVVIKKTPDTESKIVVSENGKNIDGSNVKFIINPYDEFAIEEALQVKAKVSGTEVVIASVGDATTKEIIVKGLAMGADRGVLISDDGMENWDSLTVAKILKNLVEHEKPDLIFCGKQAIDDDNMHVPTMLAELLGRPHVNVVNKLTIDGQNGIAEREVEGGKVEVVTFSLPAVIGANKALNTPRYASLPGIMKAKKKPFESKTLTDLGMQKSEVEDSIKTEIMGYEYPPKKPEGKIYKDEEVSAMVDRVATMLREEAKVI